jgi:DNA topoisomerase-1
MVAASIKLVAARLGNTPAVCRASYVHPTIVEAYLARDLDAEDSDGIGDETDDEYGLRAEELRLQRFLAACSVG